MSWSEDRTSVRISVFSLALSLAALAPGVALSADWLVPSAAHSPGAGGAFFTTDLQVSNRDTRDTTVTLKFLRHDEDGTDGPVLSYNLPEHQALAIDDVLGTAFGFTQDWGAIRVTADTELLEMTSQTSTKSATGGTFGQSVPGFAASMLVRKGAPGTIAGIRHDAGARTNLVLANATSDQVVIHGELFDADGAPVGPRKDWVVPPSGMTQATSVVEEIAGTGATIAGGRILLSTDQADAAFAAYASVIDRVTNDPRTLLPTVRPEPAMAWTLPSSAHAPGAGGAFYTTDLTLANTGTSDASVTLRYLAHDEDGTAAPSRTVEVRAAATVHAADVLGTLFGVTSGYGALVVTSTSPSLVVTSETSTKSPGGGTFGQSVPGVPDSSLVRPGSTAWLSGIREDASFRTNLVLANPTGAPVTVHVALWSPSALILGAQLLTLRPWSMTQVGHVVEALAGEGVEVEAGQLDLSTPTAGGAFAAYASVIDNATNDPRTLLP